MTANPESVVTDRFAAALHQTPSQAAAPAQQLVSGSEAYWLAEKRRHVTDGASLEPAAWSVPVTSDLQVGDRITVSSGKSQRVLEVIAVSAIEAAPGTTRSEEAAGQIAVTCRDVSSPDGRLTTFLTQAGSGPSHGKTPRVL